MAVHPWKLLATAVAAVAVSATTACEPPPPRLVITVDSGRLGHDDVPGDGICESLDALGGCTLQAAIEEGNLAPDGADIVLPPAPPGAYASYGGFDATITGDVRINRIDTTDIELTDMSIVIPAGGRLSIEAVRGWNANPSTEFDVSGALEVVRSHIQDLTVRAGGAAVLDTAVVQQVDHAAAVLDGGTVIATRSTLLSGLSSGLSLYGAPGSASYLRSSVLANPDQQSSPTPGDGSPGGTGTCSGVPPTSLGYLHVEVSCGSTAQPGDANGDAELYQRTYYGPTDGPYYLEPTSPLVDAVPLGDPLCDTSAIDLYGNPRGVDGDGDGIGGCDIGAVELTPGQPLP